MKRGHPDDFSIAHDCGNALYTAVVQLLAPRILERMSNSERIGDLVECLLALDHRDHWVEGWHVNERIGDWLARLCLALEFFRITTHLPSFEGVPCIVWH
eukprot:s627_g1.t1